MEVKDCATCHKEKAQAPTHILRNFTMCMRRDVHIHKRERCDRLTENWMNRTV